MLEARNIKLLYLQRHSIENYSHRLKAHPVQLKIENPTLVIPKHRPIKVQSSHQKTEPSQVTVSLSLRVDLRDDDVRKHINRMPSAIFLLIAFAFMFMFMDMVEIGAWALEREVSTYCTSMVLTPTYLLL